MDMSVFYKYQVPAPFGTLTVKCTAKGWGIFGSKTKFVFWVKNPENAKEHIAYICKDLHS